MERWLPTLARPLSPRQRQIVQLRAEGLTLAQIASQLGLSPHGVQNASARATRRLRLMPEAERVRAIWPDTKTPSPAKG